MPNEPILSVENLSISFRNHNILTKETDDLAVVKGISFDLYKGKTLALVGESGSGKSVSALSILKLLPYPQASHPSGSIQFEGQDLLTQSPKNLQAVRGNHIGMIFQEPMTSLNPLHTIGKQLSEAINLHQKLSPKETKARINQLLKDVELENMIERLNAYPHELSGGQRQRVMIALAISNQPDILIADEPTTALDVTVQAHVLRLLQDLQKKHGMAILLITHDLTIVEHMADHVAVMKEGNIVEQNAAKTLFENPQHTYTKKLIGSAPKGNPVKSEANKNNLLQANQLSVNYPMSKNLFGRVKTWHQAAKSIDLTIRAGETIGVVGESGSGKTTLALACLRLIHSEGEIFFNDLPIHTYDKDKMRGLRKDMQVVFQDPFSSLNPRLTIGQIINEGLLAHNIGKDQTERDALIEACLEEVEMPAAARHKYPHEFSGGQRQRIGIGRALVLNPKLIVLDEPTSALDLSTQSAILKLLKKLQKERQLSYLFITHDLRVIKAIAHEIIVMKDGEIVEQGSHKSLFNNPKQAYTKRLLSAALEIKEAS